MSSADERPRHRGISHHTRTVLGLLLAPVVVVLPPCAAAELDPGAREDLGADVACAPELSRHVLREEPADLEGYAASGLPTVTMGRSIEQDPLFFAAALAGGAALAGMLS